MGNKLETARQRLEQAKADLHAAEKAEREAMAQNAGAPDRILTLCERITSGQERGGDSAELATLVYPIAKRLADALKNRCRGQCGEHFCRHDDAAERIAGVR